VIGGDENNGEPALMFGGSIDEVRIYDRALDDDEIRTLFQAR
jgi:Concanavalin A-like lectin/glucanases superfamily